MVPSETRRGRYGVTTQHVVRRFLSVSVRMCWPRLYTVLCTFNQAGPTPRAHMALGVR